MLCWLGSKPAEGGYVIAARFFTAYYFFHFLILLPLLGLFETPTPRPASITEDVLAKSHKGSAPAQPDGAAASPETKA